jgi:hypothetical protein
MTTKTLSNQALSTIDSYLHFKLGPAVCAVPYFNNKTVRARAAFRAQTGKGSPGDIFDEVQALTVKNHIAVTTLSDSALKMLLADNNIGIECSGFAYYILNSESRSRGLGTIDKHLTFINQSGILGKIRTALRPAENCDVKTLANEKNSDAVSVANILPGDMITMQKTMESSPADHILIVEAVDYEGGLPTKIHYVHSVAYPEDGVYGTGVRKGHIEITDSNLPIGSQNWIEDGKRDSDNRLFIRAQKSRTEVRRLGWFV